MADGPTDLRCERGHLTTRDMDPGDETPSCFLCGSPTEEQKDMATKDNKMRYVMSGLPGVREDLIFESPDGLTQYIKYENIHGALIVEYFGENVRVFGECTSTWGIGRVITDALDKLHITVHDLGDAEAETVMDAINGR